MTKELIDWANDFSAKNKEVVEKIKEIHDCFDNIPEPESTLDAIFIVTAIAESLKLVKEAINDSIDELSKFETEIGGPHETNLDLN